MGIIHAQISYQKKKYIKNLTSFKEVDRQQNQWIQDGQCDMCPEDLEESQRPMGPTDRLKSPVLQNFLQVQGTLTILPVMVEKKSNLRKRIMAMRKERAFLEMCRSYGNLNPSKHLGNFHWNGLSWPINRQHNARIQGCFQCSTGYRSGFMLDKLGFVFSLVIDCLRMSYSLLSFSMLQNSCCSTGSTSVWWNWFYLCSICIRCGIRVVDTGALFFVYYQFFRRKLVIFAFKIDPKKRRTQPKRNQMFPKFELLVSWAFDFPRTNTNIMQNRRMK